MLASLEHRRAAGSIRFAPWLVRNRARLGVQRTTGEHAARCFGSGANFKKGRRADPGALARLSLLELFGARQGS
jgi:hypothetical protein